MKITIADLKEMRGADMPIILQDCKYVTGWGMGDKPIEGPWGWMVHVGEADAMENNDYVAFDNMGFHFLYDGLDFVEVDTSDVTIDSDGIYVSKPTIWVEPTETVEACETSAYYVQKALGDGYNVCQWGRREPVAWYPTLEDAEWRYYDLNGWND